MSLNPSYNGMNVPLIMPSFDILGHDLATQTSLVKIPTSQLPTYTELLMLVERLNVQLNSLPGQRVCTFEEFSKSLGTRRGKPIAERVIKSWKFLKPAYRMNDTMLNFAEAHRLCDEFINPKTNTPFKTRRGKRAI